jgi:hypothetical protein
VPKIIPLIEQVAISGGVIKSEVNMNYIAVERTSVRSTAMPILITSLLITPLVGKLLNS